MARLPGRIRRISLDVGEPTNYTLEATSTYDEAEPAQVPTAMAADDVETLDQEVSVSIPPALTVTQLGTLITFTRFPKFFTGITVKIRPTYDSDAGEDPYLELWTHDSESDEWTRRASKQLRNGFVGCPSGKVKYYGGNDIDGFFLAVPRETVDKVWITLAPGTVGAPTLEFVALHVFGRCVDEPVIDGSCEADPTIECLPTDANGDPEGPADCEDLVESGDLPPGSCDTPPYDTPRLPPGGPGGPAPGPGSPPFEPPVFPTVDLCDPAALQAFKDSMTPEQLEYFLELMGDSELPCLEPDPEGVKTPNPIAPINADPNGDPILPRQPVEVYVDPNTLDPDEDPRDGGGNGSNVQGLRTQRYILTWSENDTAEALALVTSDVAPLIALDVPPDPTQIVSDHWGPDVGVSTLGVQFTPAAHGLRLTLRGLPPVAQVGIRMQTIRLRGAPGLQDSINNDGVFISPIGLGRCVPGPDWVLTPSESLAPATSELIANSFMEFFHRNLLAFNTEDAQHVGTQGVTASFVFDLPRVAKTTQNDAVPCDGTYQGRSRLGFQRGGYLDIAETPQAKERSVWLADTSAEDIDDDPGNTFYGSFYRPLVIVLDVAVRQVVGGSPLFGIGNVSATLDLAGLTDAQPVEVPD